MQQQTEKRAAEKSAEMRDDITGRIDAQEEEQKDASDNGLHHLLEGAPLRIPMTVGWNAHQAERAHHHAGSAKPVIGPSVKQESCDVAKTSG